MSGQTRRELVGQIHLRYQDATRTAKAHILDEFVAATGYRRKYAITLLSRAVTPALAPRQRQRKRNYGDDVQAALTILWKAGSCICARRLVPFLPELLGAMERFGHLSLSVPVRDRLLTISVSTADRLLAEARRAQNRGISTTKPGQLLKRQIPIRTFSDCNDIQPGFIEADLVAHCGDSAHGAFLNTLVLTDIVTGWTECVPLLRRSEADVRAGLMQARQRLPFALLGLDTDNGSEFINYEMLNYCTRERITFTRSRAYKKNDQAHVEEKNGSIVRRLIGYDRYEGLDAWRELSTLYRVLRLYVNFFQPSMKLIEKRRDGGHIKKIYDRAQTPYHRVLMSSEVSGDIKARLRAEYEALDPVALLSDMERLQNEFWKHAWKRPATDETIPGYQLPLRTRKITHLRVNAQDSREMPQAPERPDELPRCAPRKYRQTGKKHATRTWRTRPDPFAGVWEQIEQQLNINPSSTADRFFRRLREDHADIYHSGQLRTFQRRVRDWRQKHLYVDH